MNAGVLGRRVCAVLAACSGVLHGIVLGHVTNVVALALMLAMIMGCLYCARDLWTRGSVRGWVTVALMNFAMIAIHLPSSAAHHHGSGLSVVAPAHASTVMDVATALAAVEVAAAAVVLYYRSRAMRPAEAASAPRT